MQARQGGYGVISTDDMRSADDIDPLNVFVKLPKELLKRQRLMTGITMQKLDFIWEPNRFPQ